MNPEDKINEMVERLVDGIFDKAYRLDNLDLDIANEVTLKSELCKAARIGVLAMDVDEGDSYRKYTEAVQKLEKAIEAIKTD